MSNPQNHNTMKISNIPSKSPENFFFTPPVQHSHPPGIKPRFLYLFSAILYPFIPLYTLRPNAKPLPMAPFSQPGKKFIPPAPVFSKLYPPPPSPSTKKATLPDGFKISSVTLRQSSPPAYSSAPQALHGQRSSPPPSASSSHCSPLPPYR